MDFRQIEAFMNVAKYKSFSKAANALFLSQPAISSHISILEKELGVSLFDRTSKEVNLTSVGEEFLKYAIDIINIRDDALNSITTRSDNFYDMLTIAASTTPCNSILPSMIKKFSLSNPNIHYTIKEQSSGEVIKSVLNFDCEIGIVGEYIYNPKITCLKLMEDELFLASSSALKLKDSISIKDAISYPYILREKSSATRKTFEDALRHKEIDANRLNIVCEVNNLDSLFQFIKHGIGVSVVSKIVSQDYVKLGAINLSSIEGLTLKRNIYIIVSSKRTLTPAATIFYNSCKNTYDLN